MVEVQQLHRGMVNKGHCLEILKQLFHEVSCRLKRETENIGLNRVAKLQLDLRQGHETKDMTKITLFHEECHPKDVPR